LNLTVLECNEPVVETPQECDAFVGLRVERISDTGRLAALRQPWNALVEDVPFRRWEWLEAWWRFFATSRDQLTVLAVYDVADRLVGLAPWYCHRSPIYGRELRFLGSGMVCSDYLTIFTAPGAREAVTLSIANWLNTTFRGQWDALELEAVVADDPTATELAMRFALAGHVVYRRPALHCWRLELPTEWEEYIKSLSGTRRNMVRKLIRNRFDSGEAKVCWVETAEELNRGLDILRDLHQRRRNTLGQPGCFATPGFDGFLKLVAERFLELDQLRLQWIELNGQPVAIEFDLAGGDVVYLYQSGIEPQAASDRPGWLGAIAALRRCGEDGYRAFDFMRGDEPYKAHWRAQPIALVDLRITAGQPAARVRQIIWRGAQRGKLLAKRVRAAWRERGKSDQHKATPAE